MDVYSMELGIGLSFVKTSEFQGGVSTSEPSPLGTPLKLHPLNKNMTNCKEKIITHTIIK
jgi:hypothetical protein